MKKIKSALNAIIFAGTFGLADHNAQKRISIGINIMSLWIILINSTIGMVAYAVTRGNLLLYGITSEIFVIVLPIALNYKRAYLSASISFFGIILLATCYFSCLLGKSVESQLMIIYLIGVSIFLFDNIFIQVASVILSIGMIILLELNFKHEFIKPMSIAQGVNAFMRWSVYGVVIFLVLVTFILYKRNNHRLLKELQQYNSKVEINLQNEENKNKIKDRFISNATHEMKVSFHSIFSIINILYKVEKKLAMQSLKQPIDDLRAACGISKSIIENILEYEKHEAGMNIVVRNQLVDIRVIVSNIIDIYKYVADERSVKINLTVTDNVMQHIIVDEVILRQIITNLLHNAIKFTRYGTEIEIRLEMSRDELSIFVEDQGEGISKSHLTEIFEPFITRNPEGLGLGLYIVKELVSALGGKVRVLQTSEAGTVFHVVIPNRSLTQTTPQYQLVGSSN